MSDGTNEVSMATAATGNSTGQGRRPSARTWSRGDLLRVGIPLGFIVILVVAAYVAPLPYDPRRGDSSAILEPPSANHWFGTDRFGFDVFSRLIASAGLDIPLAAVGMLFSLVVGVPLGLVAGFKGKWGERFMRALDMFQAFPLLILAIAIVALMGNRIENVVIAIAIINVPRFIRLVRSEALSLRESRFVEAAYAIGAPRTRVMFRHLLPNMTGTILAQSSLAIAHSIVVIAALSFLGIGVRSSDASWGAMIQSGSPSITTGQWWPAVFPGVAVFVTVLCFNAIAELLNQRAGRV